MLKEIQDKTENFCGILEAIHTHKNKIGILACKIQKYKIQSSQIDLAEY